MVSYDPSQFPDDAFPDWVAALQFEAIPAAVIGSAKQALLDTLAVGWAGWSAEGVGPVLNYLQGTDMGESTVWGKKDRLGPPVAALVNGLLAAALDYDIVHDGATAHTHIVMVPALIALAEATKASGRDFLTAYVAGCEMAVRLGLGVQANPGWALSSVFCVLACAAACAKLLGLGREGVRAAVGIALTRASGTQQSLMDGSFTKRLQTAFAARDAVESAQLVQRGVTGPRQPFTSRAGFQALYVHLDAQRPFVDLGKVWHFSQGTVKNFPSCFCNHAAILAAQQAVGRLLSPDEIAVCKVRIPPFANRLVGSAFMVTGDPQLAAQFSVQYSVANALLRGGLALEDISTAAVTDPAVVGLAHRVEVEVDESATQWYTPATVELVLCNGSAFTARVEVIPGTPSQPATPAELRAKARACFVEGVPSLLPSEFDQLFERIDQLERMFDMGSFWALQNNKAFNLMSDRT